jgi:hypothetical protein
LPVIAFALRRRRITDDARARVVVVAASSYLMLYVILLWQALRGQSLVQPDGPTLVALIAWAVVTVVAAWRAAARDAPAAGHIVALS